MPKNKPVLILVVATSFGEVDWILPALHVFKHFNPEWQIITLFGHKLVFDNLKRNVCLFEEFKQISDLNIVPEELPLLFRQNINRDQVKIILKDYNKDEWAPYKLQLMDACPKALVVSYPHSNHIYSNRETDQKKVCSDPEAWGRHDIFLLNSVNDVAHWSAHVDTARMRIRGYPRYDSWWLERILSHPTLYDSQEWRFAQGGRTLFYISRGPHMHYLSKEDYRYLVESLLETVFSYDDLSLLIKPHPRQDLGELYTMLSRFDTSRVMVSGLHLIQLSSLADVVVSGWSSGILDALSVGAPVIEFWRFSGTDPLCRRKENGTFTTIYRELGLAAAAETKEELDKLVRLALEAPDDPIWLDQQRAFLRHCKFTDRAAEGVAECLIDELFAKTGEAAFNRKERETVRALSWLAKMLSETKDNAAAIEALEAIRPIFSDHPQLLKLGGKVALELSRWGDAEKYYSKVYERAEDDIEAIAGLIAVKIAVDDLEDAQKLASRFISRAPNARARRVLRQRLMAAAHDIGVDLNNDVILDS